MTADNTAPVPVWTLATEDVSVPNVLGDEGMTPARLAELRTVLATLAAAPIATLEAHPPSGDWRPWKGGLEMIAALAVPVQGFPVPRSQLALSASGISALILPGLQPEDIVQPRSREFLRRRASLSAAARVE